VSVLAIDPGLTKPGVALLQRGRIVLAERLRVPKGWSSLEILERCDRLAELAVDWFERRPCGSQDREDAPHTLVVEWPQWYGDKAGIDANDLAGLCGIAGATLARLRCSGMDLEARSPTPREVWGTVPKATTGDPWASPRGRRLATRLDVSERAVVANYHDALDAAGLALWAAGRWKARRNYPGAV
jgi:hypothetical protein